MKFVHIADMHFDSPFINLSEKDGFGDLRRLDQRKAFKKIIEYIKENNIDYLFIAGDFYEHQYVKKSTIEYINNLFKEIPNTKIFISPGNHDPILKNSFYKKYIWNSNVKIFEPNLEKVELEDVNIYGFGFDDFHIKNTELKKIKIDDDSKLNVLVMHGSLNTVATEDMEYNEIKENELKALGFDYVALGHIHKLYYNNYENQRIVYPGSTISLGFDELGKHGMIVGDINKEKINLKFIPLDDKEFIKKNLDVTEIISKEELVEKINELDIAENNFYEIILCGYRNFEINIYELKKLITNDRIIKIKDKTEVNYDLEKLANESTLKGLFVKNIKEKLNNENINEEDKKILKKALEIGLNVLN